MAENRVEDIDWLAAAIGNLGGVQRAASAIGVSRQTIYAWLETGLTGVSFDSVVRLSEKSGVPLSILTKRLGPWKEFQKTVHKPVVRKKHTR